VSKYRVKIQSGILTFYCRSWAIYHWRRWKKCFCGGSRCYIRVTMRVMMTVIRTSLAGPEVLRNERLLCCPLFAGNGVRRWLAGHNHLLVIGWRRWLNVSWNTFYSASA